MNASNSTQTIQKDQYGSILKRGSEPAGYSIGRFFNKLFILMVLTTFSFLFLVSGCKKEEGPYEGLITVKGRVTEQGTGRPIPFAKVIIYQSLPGGGWGIIRWKEYGHVYSDENGYYTFNDLNIRVTAGGEFWCEVEADRYFDSRNSGGQDLKPFLYQKKTNLIDFDLFAIGILKATFLLNDNGKDKRLYVVTYDNTMHDYKNRKEVTLFLSHRAYVTDTLQYNVMAEDSFATHKIPIFITPLDTPSLLIEY